LVMTGMRCAKDGPSGDLPPRERGGNDAGVE
jgi:hypothetical protein